jgi:hypothetical protein
VVADRERTYLLERCLRLELRIAQLEGRATESPAPTVHDVQHAQSPARVEPVFVRRIYRAATADEIALVRELRRRGMSYNDIGYRVGRSEHMARRYAKDVPIEQGAGEQ